MKIKPKIRMKTTFVTSVALTIAIMAVAPATNATMKAIVVHHYGAPELLNLEQTPRPQPKDDEGLIQVMAAGVNPIDAYIRRSRFGADKLPYVPGLDVAGVVAANGSKAKKFKPGDAVLRCDHDDRARRGRHAALSADT